MRFLPNILRTICTFTATALRAPLPLQYKAVARFPKPRVIESMPVIPLLGSLFSSSSGSKDMSYPVQKSDDEWRAVLSKGRCSGGGLQRHCG
jgi:peptide-methionine (R)-S-oxide reductase